MQLEARKLKADTMDQNSSDLSKEDALRALELFVVDNDDLFELEERIGRFNVFDALRVARVEIRHSNFLAWLLDPLESHGQGALFLRAILMDLLRDSPTELRPFSPVQLDGVELHGVEIRREWRNLDILITCESPSFVIAIENKVGSGEHGGQLQRYEEIVRDQFPDQKSMFVFLSIEGMEASREDWVPYSYGDIHRVLDRCRRAHAGAFGDDVAVFLEHYLRLVGSRFMDDPEIDELCQRIYRNHRSALDLICERADPSSTGLVKEIKELIEQQPDRWHVINVTTRYIEFIPREWRDLLPPVGTRATADPHHWLILRVDFRKKDCSFVTVVWPTKDLKIRERVIKRLTLETKEFGFRAKKGITGSWTHLCREIILEWKEDDWPDIEKVKQKVTKTLVEVHPRLIGVRDALQKILKTS